MYDFINSLFGDFKMKIKKRIFSSYFIATSEKGKKRSTSSKNYLMCLVKNSSNYGSVRIVLLNIAINNDIKLFLKLFFTKKNKNFFERGITKFPQK